VPCTGEALRAAASSFYAVDWDPTALHLRYLAAAERAWVEDPSVAASRRAATGQFRTVPSKRVISSPFLHFSIY
jgi:hypothetical protein